ncbi:MAG: hypothetical protein AAF755_03135 [Pseudomonadota bacterium]
MSRRAAAFNLGRLTICAVACAIASTAAQANERWNEYIAKRNELSSESAKYQPLSECYPKTAGGRIGGAPDCVAKRRSRDQRIKHFDLQKLSKGAFEKAYRALRPDATDIETLYKSCNPSGKTTYAGFYSPFGNQTVGLDMYHCDVTLGMLRVEDLRPWVFENALVGNATCNIRRERVRARADGCSIPDWLNDPASEHFKGVFKRDCDYHDICYSTPGSKKEQCDTEMQNDMRITCKYGNDKSQFARLCVTTAGTWHSALAISSESKEKFNENQVWASSNCGK